MADRQETDSRATSRTEPRTLECPPRVLVAGTRAADLLRKDGTPLPQDTGLVPRAFLGAEGRTDPPAADVTPIDVRRWQAHRAATGHGRAGDAISPTTLNLEHRALRSFWRWALREEAIGGDPMANVRPPRPQERPVEVLSDTDFERLLSQVVGKDFEHRRNEAILRFLWSTGARLGETAGLVLAGGDLADKLAKVTGKGNRVHVVAFDSDTRRSLDRYIRIRRSHAQAARTELCLGPKGSLTESGVYQVIRDAGLAAGTHVHPHQFRHTSAHRQLAAGMPEQTWPSTTGRARRCSPATVRPGATRGPSPTTARGWTAAGRGRCQHYMLCRRTTPPLHIVSVGRLAVDTVRRC